VDRDWWPHLRGRRVWEHNGEVCLELRWAGHQSVIAGAHPETKGYSWLPDSSPAEREVAIAPDWLLEPLLRRTRPAGSPLARLGHSGSGRLPAGRP
jgi:hypothetical protein